MCKSVTVQKKDFFARVVKSLKNQQQTITEMLRVVETVLVVLQYCTSICYVHFALLE